MLSVERLPTQKEVEEIERDLQIAFPAAFREFLLSTNVAEPEANFFAVGKKERHGGLRVLFGLSSDPARDLRSQWRKHKARLPVHRLPIGDAEGGNLVCLNTKTGAIEFWDHELAHGRMHGLEMVASSFQEFLSALRPQDVELAPGDVKEAWINPDFLASLRKREN
jgi:hypothetical protein